MKKYLSLLLLVILVCSLTACGGSGSSGSVSGNSNASAMDALPEDATPAQTVIADFTDKMNSSDFDSLEKLATALSEAEYLGFDGAVMQVEEGYLNGFSDEISGFSEGWMFGPVIGSIPFVGYVFTADDDAAAADLIKTLEASADLGWNICTRAEDMQSGSVGNTVCFVMSPSSFEE